MIGWMSGWGWQASGCMCKSLQSCPPLCKPWTVAHYASLSVEFSRHEYWSGLPCPPAGYLPDPGIEPTSFTSSALEGKFFTTSTTWEALASGYVFADWAYIQTGMRQIIPSCHCSQGSLDNKRKGNSHGLTSMWLWSLEHRGTRHSG